MCDLKRKLDEWRIWLHGEDRNSIRNQIHAMIWDSAVFQSINKAREYAPSDAKGNPELNDMTHGFINRSFFTSQMIAIRRLWDKETRKGKRSVISLFRLIDDMQNHCHLLTRESLLAAHGYPYDYEQKRELLNRERLADSSRSGLGGDLINCAHSKGLHFSMDILAGVDSSQRKPNDAARKEVFQWLKDRLDGSCKGIQDYVNKFLAHSATPESRETINADDTKIMLGSLFDAHQTVCQVAQFIGMKILYRGLGNVLVTPQYDQFEYFDKPWATEDIVTELYRFWKAYDGETRQWLKWNWRGQLSSNTRIPSNYEYIGKIVHVWPEAQAFGVQVLERELETGDRIAFECPIGHEEAVVKSLQLNGQDQQAISVGEEAGVRIDRPDLQLRNGIKVYKVKHEDDKY